MVSISSFPYTYAIYYVTLASYSIPIFSTHSIPVDLFLSYLSHCSPPPLRYRDPLNLIRFAYIIIIVGGIA